METNLENLSSLVAAHRQGKKRGQYPTAVWESVSALRKTHTVEEIARASGIHVTQIYKKTSGKSGKRRPLFREVRLAAPTVTAKPVVVELRRSDGAELRLRCDANREELSGLFSSFLHA